MTDVNNENEHVKGTFVMVCAACKKRGGKPLKCSACKMVRYCSSKCQKAHWKDHKSICRLRSKFLKSAEARRQEERQQEFLEALPKEPEECPICMLPLPVKVGLRKYMACCGKVICRGCEFERGTVVYREGSGRSWTDLQRAIETQPCAFCRSPNLGEGTRCFEALQKRVQVNDFGAMTELAHYYDMTYDNAGVVPYDDRKAAKLLLKAADLGSATAAFGLTSFFAEGRGGLPRDKVKELQYTELAAKRGYVPAQHNLAHLELSRGNYEATLFFWSIAASMGDDLALKNYREAYDLGRISKENFERVLRAHYSSTEAARSECRDRFQAVCELS